MKTDKNPKGSGRKKGEPKKAIGQRVLIRFHSQCVKAALAEEKRLLELERLNGL